MNCIGFFVLLSVSLSIVWCDDGKRAFLALDVEYVVKPEVRSGDQIQYTCLLRHRDNSPLEAVNIMVEIMLPDSVQLIESTSEDSEEYKIVTHSGQRIDYIISSLPIDSQVEFNFVAVISNDHLSPGLHYASTPIKLRYASKISTNHITPLHEISMVAQVPYFVAGCSQALGITDGSIKFYQLSASSMQADLKPYKVRMNGADDAWCADPRDETPHIQIFLSHKAKVTGIGTWGRNVKQQWVKKYTMEFSNDGSMWFAYTDTGMMKKFVANYDQHTKVVNWLTEPFEANYIRLYPVEWSIGLCMRLELYGCHLMNSKNCIDPIGMGIKRQSPVGTADSSTWLDSVAAEFPYIWLADRTQSDYLQIDLGSNFQITAVAIQADNGSAIPFVSKFRVSYSIDSYKWIDKDNHEHESKEFPGSVGGYLPDILHFSPPFAGRHVRIEPTDDKVVSMRIELYGCLSADQNKPQASKDIELSRRSVLIDDINDFIYVCMYTNDHTKSICKRSKDGRRWTSLGFNIMGVVHQDRSSRRLFAVNRQFGKIYSDNNGDTWTTVSEKEWIHLLRDVEVTSFTNIHDGLTTKMPDSRFTWTTQQGTKWGASGTGIYRMGVQAVGWTLCAVWTCCGM